MGIPILIINLEGKLHLSKLYLGRNLFFNLEVLIILIRLVDDDNQEQVVDTESRAWQGFSAGSRRSSPGTGDHECVVTRAIPGIARPSAV